jgi:hypothetical protein
VAQGAELGKTADEKIFALAKTADEKFFRFSIFPLAKPPSICYLRCMKTEREHAESGCTDYLQHSADSCPHLKMSNKAAIETGEGNAPRVPFHEQVRILFGLDGGAQ